MYTPPPDTTEAATIARIQQTWQAMLDEPQDPTVAARIAARGKRVDKD